MKKNIVIWMMLLLASVGAMAQEVENPVGKFSVIPRVGVALSNWSNNSVYVSDALGDEIKSKNQAGFMVGADVEYRATEYVGVSLGAYYARLGYRFADYEIVENADKKQYWGIKNHHADIDYIQLPLMLKGYVTRQLVAMVGIQAGFRCGDAKYSYEETSLEKDKNGSTYYKDTKEVEGTLVAKSTNISIPVGVSYEYMNVILDARYNIGLTKMENISGFDSPKNSFFTFTVGYRFTL